VQAFAFGRCRSVLEGLSAAVGGPVAFLTPPQWKRLVGVAGQERCEGRGASAAVRRWPGEAALFALRNSDGRAEASMPDWSDRDHAGGPRGLDTTSMPYRELTP
jgi:hypothetical protein